MLKLDGVEQFNAGLDLWLQEVEELSVKTLRGLAVKVFKAALNNSPQFSGNAVANWKFSVNAVDTSSDDFFKELFYEKITPEVVAFSKTTPNELAEDYAIAGAAGRELQVTKLSDIVYVTNSVDYADWLANATEDDLRQVNHVGHLIAHTAADVTEAHLFINTNSARVLARERIV